MSDWIPVCEFPPEDDLAELAQFIYRHRLPLKISEEGNRQVLSTLDPRLSEPLRALVQRWRAGEIDLAQVSVEAQASVPASERPNGDAPVAQGSYHRERELMREMGDDVDSPYLLWRKTPLCLLLIALCFFGWWLLRGGHAEGLIIFPERGGDFELARSTLAWHLAQGEYWRLWTPAIVHFSLPHALFNALGIWILGRPLEARAGTLAFAVLVLISAVAANLLQYYWAPQNLFGGMSGVVYALVGAVFVLQRWRPDWREVPAGIVGLAMVWLLLCATGLVTYIIGVGVANAAHIGGFASGLLLTLLYCGVGGARNFAPEKL